MHQNPIQPLWHKQSGVVLITALIFLVILTMIVLSIMRGATLEERMASNTSNRQLSLQAAEAVLRDASENLLNARHLEPFDKFDPTQFTSACTNGICNQPAGDKPRWQTIDWTDTGITRTFAATGSNLTGFLAQPRYIVELIGYSSGGQGRMICPLVLYQLTARGLSQDGAVVFVQTMHRTQPATCPGLA